MIFYFIGSEEGFNEVCFSKVEEWQSYMGIRKSVSEISLLETWKPVKLKYVYGEKSKKNKQFDLSQYCDPLFTVSEKALKVLENIFKKTGEILEIEYPKGFYFYHCTNMIDALVEEKSDIVWLDKEKGWISGINKFVLDKKLIKNELIFRLPFADNRYTFFGNEFKKIVCENNLSGIHFHRYEKIIIE